MKHFEENMQVSRDSARSFTQQNETINIMMNIQSSPAYASYLILRFLFVSKKADNH